MQIRVPVKPGGRLPPPVIAALLTFICIPQSLARARSFTIPGVLNAFDQIRKKSFFLLNDAPLRHRVDCIHVHAGIIVSWDSIRIISYI